VAANREPIWRFYLLGGLQILRAGEAIPLPPPRTHALLASLLLHPHPWQRSRLIGLLFSNETEQSGRRRLSDRLWLLRRALDDLPILSDVEQIELPAGTRWLDVEAFRQSAARSGLADQLAAIELYRGDLLPDCSDDWLLLERESLYLEYVHLLLHAGDHLLHNCRFETALTLARQLVREEPFDEAALRMLMRAHTALGQRGAALAAYEHFIETAADELGIEPGKATRSLARSIQTAAPFCSLEAPLPADSPPDLLLQQAQTALERGDQARVKRCLERLNAQPAPANKTAVRLLRVDLALFCGDYDLAGQTLAKCKTGQAAVEARAAALALARDQTTAAHDTAARALLLAHDERDRQSELEALLTLARTQLRLGQSSRALASARQALNLAQRSASTTGAIRARLAQGTTLYRQGQCREAIPIFYEAQSLAYEHDLRRYLAEALYGLANARAELGVFGQPLDTLRQALSIWRDLGVPRQEARVLQSLSSLYDLLGRSAEAIRALDRARQIYEQTGDPVGVARSKYHLAAGIPYHDETELPRAIALAREALDTFREYEQPGWEAASLAALGYAQWLHGQHTAALDALRRAWTLYRQLGEISFLPELLAYQGLAHLELGSPAEALDCTRRALLALAQGPAENDIISETYYAHAMVLAADGREEQACDYFTRAYHNLLDYAAQFEDESARQAFFRRDPTVRRLMEEVYTRGIAPPPDSGIVTRWFPPHAGSGQRPLPVKLTLDAGPSDASLKRSRGAITLRRERLARILRESRAQGVRPTIRQLAADLGVSPRTIKRDLAALRQRES
jgi:DNA-binding SARP family transcriptional activator/AraC-like DNA-binding protein